MIDISKQPSWQRLLAHQQSLAKIDMRQLFQENPERFQQFSLSAANLLLDYSKNYLSQQSLKYLYDLAIAAKLPARIHAMFNGDMINCTEKKAAMHIALRHISQDDYQIAGKPISPEIRHVFEKMCNVAEKISNSIWLGFNGHPITDIVNIGIGGSDLGPRMVTVALSAYHTKRLRCHFVSNIDAAHILSTLQQLNPETTLFIIASKTFTTEETLQNARIAKQWLLQHSKQPQAYAQHFIAVTAQIERAIHLGIPEANCFKIWDWVGGRYSVWSAIGLPILLAIGKENFVDFLAGAACMDQHFRTQPIQQNMPVILALLGIWYHNFWQAQTHAILPYAQALKHLPAYLQQADMESNGKQISLQGEAVNYTTGPIIWGEVGCNGQHAFHQLFHQGTYLIPIDFIVAAQADHGLAKQHAMLYANCIGQSQALLQGKSLEQAYAELRAKGYSATEAEQLAPHLVIPGNRPSNTIVMPKLTPFNLGSLLALYEHKIFTQGVIWNINSFDQWGVELGKQLAKNLLNSLNQPDDLDQYSDSSTRGLIAYYHHQ